MRDMMGHDNLYAESDGLRSFAQTHSKVASGMSSLVNSSSYAADVAATHGPIASGVHGALSGVIDTRQGVQRSVLDVGRNLADSLRQAARSYEGVDEGTADKLRSAANAVEGANAPDAGRGAGSAGGNMKDIAGTLTGAGKDAAGAIGGVIGPMTSGLGSAASSLGSGLSSAAGAAANSITQAVGQAAKAGAAPAAAVPAAAPLGGNSEQGGPAEKANGTTVSEGSAPAGTGDGNGASKVSGEHVIFARSTSGPEGGGTVV
jgi:Excreted virulence factor EspC, type VII ESX diderm